MTWKIELRVKMKSLAAEARIIRKEEARALRLERYRAKAQGRACNHWQQESLRKHRTVQLRREARASGLAYAFIRGVPYRAVEQHYRDKPDWFAVQKLIQKFGAPLASAPGFNGIHPEIETWAEAHYEPASIKLYGTIAQWAHMRSWLKEYPDPAIKLLRCPAGYGTIAKIPLASCKAAMLAGNAPTFMHDRILQMYGGIQ